MPTKQKPRRRVWLFLVLTVLGVVLMCGVEAIVIAGAMRMAVPASSPSFQEGWSDTNPRLIAWELQRSSLPGGAEMLLGTALPNEVKLARRGKPLTSSVPSWSIFAAPPEFDVEMLTSVRECAYGWPVPLYIQQTVGIPGFSYPPIERTSSALAWKNATGFLAASTVVSAVGSLGLLRLGGWLRRRRARLRNACEHCGYDLSGLDRGNANAVCPECGEPSASGTGPGR